MNPYQEWVKTETRRQFFSRGANAVGWAALASLIGPKWLCGSADAAEAVGRTSRTSPPRRST